MNITYRVPHPNVPYAYIELTGEIAKTTDPDEIRQVFDLYNKAFQDSEGLTEPEWKKWLDEYVSTGTVADGADRWAMMSEKQKWCVNEIKKARSRKGMRGEATIN